MKKIFFFLFLLFTVSFYAQSEFQKPFIEITGIAETEIVPNEIYLEICIKERNEKGKKLTLDYLENELKSVLRKIGIPEKNLVISDINAVLAKTGWWSEEILAVGNYSLKVNGAEKLKQLFENFKKLNISEVSITKATHDNIIEIKKQNRIKAIKNAKEKANYLLSAIGEQTGKPIIIREFDNNNSNFVNANVINSANNASFYTSSSKTERYKNEAIEFQKIKITSSMYVKFQIE